MTNRREQWINERASERWADNTTARLKCFRDLHDAMAVADAEWKVKVDAVFDNAYRAGRIDQRTEQAQADANPIVEGMTPEKFIEFRKIVVRIAHGLGPQYEADYALIVPEVRRLFKKAEADANPVEGGVREEIWLEVAARLKRIHTSILIMLGKPDMVHLENMVINFLEEAERFARQAKHVPSPAAQSGVREALFNLLVIAEHMHKMLYEREGDTDPLRLNIRDSNRLLIAEARAPLDGRKA